MHPTLQNDTPDLIWDRFWYWFSIFVNFVCSMLFCVNLDRFRCAFHVSSAVAGTQLCCALRPPRQALCLRMAYGVPYPNLITLPYFLMIPFPNIKILPESFLESPLRTRYRGLVQRLQCVPWILEVPRNLQDASKMGHDAPRYHQEGPRRPQDAWSWL